ncbi:MAG: hypothetical protein AAFN13_09835 [Bacteroidota bacterium]
MPSARLDWLATALATQLLGGGFGVGELTIYGRFEADSEATTITDDPTAPMDPTLLPDV